MLIFFRCAIKKPLEVEIPSVKQVCVRACVSVSMRLCTVREPQRLGDNRIRERPSQDGRRRREHGCGWTSCSPRAGRAGQVILPSKETEGFQWRNATS